MGSAQGRTSCTSAPESPALTPNDAATMRNTGPPTYFTIAVPYGCRGHVGGTAAYVFPLVHCDDTPHLATRFLGAVKNSLSGQAEFEARA